MGLWGTWTCSVTTLESTGIAYWNGSREFQHFSNAQKRCAAKADQWSSWCFFWFSCRCCRWHVIFCSQQPSSKNEFHQLKFQQDFLVKTGKKLGKTTKPSWFNSWKRASFYFRRSSQISWCQVMAQEDLVDYSDEEVPRTIEVVFI